MQTKKTGWQGIQMSSVRAGQTAYGIKNAAVSGQNRVGIADKTGSMSGTAKRSGGKITVRRRISAATYLIRLAQARTASQVGSVMRTARADLEYVRTCSTEQSDVETAKRILEHVLERGQVKTGRLRKERMLEQQEKQAKLVKKREIAEKLQRKRRARRAEEAADAGSVESVEVVKELDADRLTAWDRAVMADAVSISVSLEGAEEIGIAAESSTEAGAETGGTVDISI